jgi:dUTP pyrophosphatase
MFEYYLLDEKCAPFRGSEYASGFDLHARIPEKHELLPGSSVSIPTGIEVSRFRRPNLELQIRPRSGLLFNKGITTFLGTVDFDYRGEIKVCLFNLSKEVYIVEPYERIAQAVIAHVPSYTIRRSYERNKHYTERGSSGFGSSGTLA